MMTPMHRWAKNQKVKDDKNKVDKCVSGHNQGNLDAVNDNKALHILRIEYQ